VSLQPVLTASDPSCPRQQFRGALPARTPVSRPGRLVPVAGSTPSPEGKVLAQVRPRPTRRRCQLRKRDITPSAAAPGSSYWVNASRRCGPLLRTLLTAVETGRAVPGVDHPGPDHVTRIENQET
jgi:hypothetical protein